MQPEEALCMAPWYFTSMHGTTHVDTYAALETLVLYIHMEGPCMLLQLYYLSWT